MSAQLLRDVSHADYHLDNLPGAPHLSRSIALTLLTRSPRHAWCLHPKLGGQRQADDSEATDGGSLLHSLLLGEGPLVRVVEANDWRTKAAQQARDQAREDGAIPILERHYATLLGTATALRERLLGLGYDFDFWEREVTITWVEEGVACKARLDLALLKAGRIADLKVTKLLTPGAFTRGIPNYGLDIQAHVYEQALAAVEPELAGRVRMEFLLLESRPPFEVAVVPIAESMRSLGRTRWAHARGIWRRCLESGQWPGYGVLAPVEAPAWALTDAMVNAIEVSEPDWMKGE